MNIRKNVSLKELTTFHIGGVASFYTEVTTKDELLDSVKYAKDNNLPFFILGDGSNILVSDSGFPGLAIKMKNEAIHVSESVDNPVITAESGVSWDSVVAISVEKGFQGIECLSGIPGSAGATPVQNIGAYGQEIKDTFIEAEALDTHTNSFVKLNATDCKFGYRYSLFKEPANKNRFIIWSISLLLKNSSKPVVTYESLGRRLIELGISDPDLAQVREAVLSLRTQNHINPAVAGNAGSFFKNPIITVEQFQILHSKFPTMPYFTSSEEGFVKLFAGWLIDQTGWKGKAHKNVSVSPKHALVIINPEGKGTAKEVVELANEITESVFQKFGVKLEPEVQYINL